MASAASSYASSAAIPRRSRSIFSPPVDSSHPSAPVSIASSTPPPQSGLPPPSLTRPLVSVVLYKLTDLRTHDHAPFAVGNASARALAALPAYSSSVVPQPAPYSRLNSAPSSSFPFRAITHCLPLTIFDPRLFGSSSLSTFGFLRTGHIRAHLTRQAVSELNGALSSRFSSSLLSRVGRPEDVVPDVVRRLKEGGADVVVLTYDEWAWEEQVVQARVAERLQALSTPLLTFWGSTLIHLQDLPFPMSHLPPVYTQFRLAVEKKWKVRDWRDFTLEGSALPLPSSWAEQCGTVPSMAELGYDEGQDPAWEPAIDSRSVVQWRGGEREAMTRVDEYIWGSSGGSIRSYQSTRNALLGRNSSSKFSPFLCQGSLSVLFVYAEIARFEREQVKNESTYKLVFELLWRDYFRFYCLFHSRRLFFPYGVKGRQRVLREKELIQPEWREDSALVEAWTQGRTGYPFIDANMRELLHSGWMSNRGRQVVASFLIKDMKLDWRIGAEWFESRLLDYDVGSNWANWAYLAGVGGDPRSSRYFSVPRQQAIHDKDGEFVGTWIPALKKKKQPSIVDALKHVHVHPDEQAAGEGAEAALPIEAYDCQPIVALLHEAKRDEHGQLVLSKKQKRAGIAVGRDQSQLPRMWAGKNAQGGGRAGAQANRGQGRGRGAGRGGGGGGGHGGEEGQAGQHRGERSEPDEVNELFFPGMRGSGARGAGRARGSSKQAKQLSMDAFIRH